MARDQSPNGAVAGGILSIGDPDVGIATAEDRIAALKSHEERDVQKVISTYEVRQKALECEIAQKEKELKKLRETREKRNEPHQIHYRRTMAWRKEGVDERVMTWHVGTVPHILLLAFMVLLDFFVFAEAYATAVNAPEFGWEAGLGGLLGIVVFVASFLFAHQLKNAALAKEQEKFLAEKRQENKDVSEDLVAKHVSRSSIFGVGFIVVVLLIVGVWLRLDAEGSDVSLSVAILQGLIPVVVVIAEYFLFDPLASRVKEDGSKEKRLENRINALTRELESLGKAKEHAIARVRKEYEVELRHLIITMQDIGMMKEAHAEVRSD